MGKRDVHIGKNTEGQGWVKKVDGLVELTHRTQEAAADAGRRMAEQLQSDHVIHGEDGRIREKNSYGADPNTPKDQR